MSIFNFRLQLYFSLIHIYSILYLLYKLCEFILNYAYIKITVLVTNNLIFFSWFVVFHYTVQIIEIITILEASNFL
jgi:hypothetical protein